MPFDYELITKEPMTHLDVAHFLVRSYSNYPHGMLIGSSGSEHYVTVGTPDWGGYSGHLKFAVVIVDGNSSDSKGHNFGIRVNGELPKNISFDKSKLEEAVRKASEELGVN